MRAREIVVFTASVLIVAALPAAGVAQNCTLSGAIGCWLGNGNADDSSANNNDGVNAGATFSPGQFGLAFDLDGITAHVRVPDYPKPESEMSGEAWVCARSAPQWATIAKNWGGATTSQFHFGLDDNSAQLSIYITESDDNVVNVIDPAVFPLTVWTHVAFVADGSQLHLYRGGIEVGTPVAYDGTLDSPLNCLGIGAKLADGCLGPDSGAPGFWNGLIDELTLYDRALSPAEIAALAAAGEGTSCLGLVEIPTLRSWGIASLALGLAGLALWRLRPTRRPAPSV